VDQQIRFCRSDDVRIAYVQVGEGPPLCAFAEGCRCNPRTLELLALVGPPGVGAAAKAEA
jgi:hypothetical protein